jgi:hypothetical protein
MNLIARIVEAFQAVGADIKRIDVAAALSLQGVEDRQSALVSGASRLIQTQRILADTIVKGQSK